MIRNVLGSVVALAGAAAAVYSPFRIWYDGREGQDYRFTELFTADGITSARANLLASVFLLFAGTALLALLGILFRTRLLVALAGVGVLGFTVLWMVRLQQDRGSLVLASDGSGLADGVAYALGGGVLLLLGAALMSGRGRGRRERHREAYGDTGGAPPPPPYEPPTAGRPPYEQPYEQPYGGQRRYDQPYGGQLYRDEPSGGQPYRPPPDDGPPTVTQPTVDRSHQDDRTDPADRNRPGPNEGP